FATTVLFSARGPRTFACALVVLGALVATIGIVQQPLSTGKIYGFWIPLDGGTPFGPFVNRNHFAGWMLMALPVTLGLVLGSLSRAMRGVRSRWRDRLVWFSSAEASQLILFAVAAIVMALALVLTMSRSGVTSFALAIALTGAIVARRKWTGGRSGVALAYLGFLVIVVISWVGADVLASRFSDTDWNELNARRGAWADANDIRSRFPLAGTGLNTYGTATVLYQQHDRTRRYTEAHNDYLQLAAEGGLLLTIPAAVCMIAFAVAVRRRFVDETSAMSYWLRVGAVTGIGSIALQETVEFSLQMPGNAALFAVLCGIALHRAPARRKS
ncbi:MAG: O-antigen ligase family protein, partial [Acidobacteria bacterium]|nr:O-antigen ligase family protein [Acidobacteriota bacterium]